MRRVRCPVEWGVYNSSRCKTRLSCQWFSVSPKLLCCFVQQNSAKAILRCLRCHVRDEICSPEIKGKDEWAVCELYGMDSSYLGVFAQLIKWLFCWRHCSEYHNFEYEEFCTVSTVVGVEVFQMVMMMRMKCRSSSGGSSQKRPASQWCLSTKITEDVASLHFVSKHVCGGALDEAALNPMRCILQHRLPV